jgi:hypothetical protein
MAEPRAYNQSIYLMAGMPYLLLGSVGFLVYRAHRQKARMDQWHAGVEAAAGREDLSCSVQPAAAISSRPPSKPEPPSA